MDAKTIELLAASFARVAAHRDEAAMIFYARLFMTAPALRPVLKRDLAPQTDELVSLLAQVVEYHRIGVEPRSYLARIGQSQAGYGNPRAHFDAVGDALIFTLAQALGDEFSPDIRAAWVFAYGEVSAAMVRATDICVPSPQPAVATAQI
jgi:hemoglobin-like flavoprotein